MAITFHSESGIRPDVGIVTRVVDGQPAGFVLLGGRGHGLLTEVVPDLRDAGTIGHAEAQVAAALGVEHVDCLIEPENDEVVIWIWRDGMHVDVGSGPTKAEALIMARRAAT